MIRPTALAAVLGYLAAVVVAQGFVLMLAAGIAGAAWSFPTSVLVTVLGNLWLEIREIATS